MSRTSLTVCLVVSLLAGNALAEEEPNGQTLFKNGRYEEALKYFRQEVRNGNKSKAVQYNIAVSLYRLGRYEASRKHFLELADQPKWQPLAWYNLGLVAEAMNEKNEAREWFELGSIQGRSEKISTLSKRKLKSLDGSRQPVKRAQSKGQEWLTLINVAAGRDSNAASLADDLVQSSSDAADNFSDLLIYGQKYVQGRAGDGMKLYGLGFSRQFSEFESLDSQVFGAGVVWEKPFQNLGSETGMRVTQLRVDGARAANQVQLKAGVLKRSGRNSFTATYLPSRFFASNDYEQIDGWQHRLDFGWRRSLDPFTISAKYRYEVNDREDRQTANGFSSYSPVRNAVIGELAWRVTRALNINVGAMYQHSDYDGTNIIRDIGGEVESASRTNEKMKVGLGMEYRFTRALKVSGAYEYIDSTDTFDVYEYDKNQFQASLEYKM